MTSRRAPLGPGTILLLALLAGGWFLQRGVAQEQNVYVQSRLFQEVLDHIADRYVDPVERGQLYDFAIDGLLRELGDPNTSLLSGLAYENFRIEAEGDYGGVGLEIVERDGYITVVGPIPGTPGDRAGIRAGDRIVEVEGESARGWTSQQAVQVLRGPPDTEVGVSIQRPGVEDLIPFTLTRARIQIRAVPFATLLEGDVGYIPLASFNETAARDVQAAADSLRQAGARALILDLRWNPGGILEQGIGVADLFLGSRLPVAETRGQAREQSQTFWTSTEDRFADVPLLVMVDRGSASAAEIVAGALQDHDRALVLGAPTFGKGSVQSLFPLSGGSVLKLTTARWYTPAGRSIERTTAPGEGEDPRPEEELQQTLGASLALDGRVVLAPDTAGRPTLASMGGRVLYGGGGIVPDVVVLPDTLTAAEQRSVRLVYREAGRFTTGVFNYAVELLQRNGDRSSQFEITEAEVEELYARLQEEGFGADRETWSAAARFVRFELEREVAERGWGAEAAFLRRAPRDLPLQEALRLLRAARSPADLFVAVGNPLGSAGVTGEDLPANAGEPEGEDGAEPR